MIRINFMQKFLNTDNFFKNWYKISQHSFRTDLHGQWWIVDGKAINVGAGEGRQVHGYWAMEKARDMVYDQDESIVRSFADQLKKAGVDIDAVKAKANKERRRFLVSELVDEELRGINFGREEEGEPQQGSHLHQEIENALTSNIDNDILRASKSASRAETWLLELGAIKVSSHAIEMQNITNYNLKTLTSAMEKALPNMSPESKVNIESSSNRKYFIEIPWGTVREGDPRGLWIYESK